MRDRRVLFTLLIAATALLPVRIDRMPALVAFAQQPAEKTIPDGVRLFIPYKHYSPEDNQRILAMYKYLRVADVSDGMDVVGLQDVGLVAPEIRALWKDTATFSHRVAGIAVTARYVLGRYRAAPLDLPRLPAPAVQTERVHERRVIQLATGVQSR